MDSKFEMAVLIKDRRKNDEALVANLRTPWYVSPKVSIRNPYTTIIIFSRQKQKKLFELRFIFFQCQENVRGKVPLDFFCYAHVKKKKTTPWK